MTTPRLVRAPRRPGGEFWLVIGLLAVGVALPLAVSAFAGTLEIPRNDDWSYRRIALDLARSGEFMLDGISTTMIVGQILLTQPLLWLSGLDPLAFTVAGTGFAIGGVLSAYALARRILPARDAALVASLLILFPGYLAYATSFMSDVPALGAQFTCLALGAMAVKSRPVRGRWLIASLAIGIVGFSIREFAVAAPASVIIVAISLGPRRLGTWAPALGTAAGCVAIAIWRTSLPGQVPPVGPGWGSLPALIPAFSSVAFVLAPAALVGAMRWRRHIKSSDLWIGLEIGTILVVGRALQWMIDGEMPPILLFNLASQQGVPAGPYMVGVRPSLFGDAAWAALNGLALVASAVVLTVGTGVAGAHLRRLGRSLPSVTRVLDGPAWIHGVFALAVIVGLVVFSVSRPTIDRYFWPLVPALAALFLYVPADVRKRTAEYPHRVSGLALAAGAGLFAAALAIISMIFLLNSHAYDAARWSAGERLAEEGLQRDRIDAGYEWVGYHATGPGDPTDRSSTETFYRSWWQSFSPCGVVSNEPLRRPDLESIGTQGYMLALVAGPVVTLYIYRVTTLECRDG